MLSCQFGPLSSVTWPTSHHFHSYRHTRSERERQQQTEWQPLYDGWSQIFNLNIDLLLLLYCCFCHSLKVWRMVTSVNIRLDQGLRFFLKLSVDVQVGEWQMTSGHLNYEQTNECVVVLFFSLWKKCHWKIIYDSVSLYTLVSAAYIHHNPSFSHSANSTLTHVDRLHNEFNDIPRIWSRKPGPLAS